MSEWLVRRREFRLAEQSGTEEPPPSFGALYDVAGESIAAVVHIVMGAGVAVLMAAWGQVSGGFAAFAVGASAPLILVQLKHTRLAEVVVGDPGAPPQAPQPQSSTPQDAQPPVTGPPNEQAASRRPAAGPRGAE